MPRHFLFSLFPLLLLPACSRHIPPRYEQVLGTVCTVNAFKDGTTELYDALFARLEEIDAVFSTTRPESELCRLNARAGSGPAEISGECWRVLSEALRYAEATDGALNPALGAAVALWGINTERARVPLQEELAAVKPLCDWRDVVLSSDGGRYTAELKKPGMMLDLGAIAKGYAADELASMLRERRVRQAVINLGGNVYVLGKKADGSSWQVGIKDPFMPDGEPLVSLSLEEGSVVTSGTYERYFEANGVRYHHILDSATCSPAGSGLLSVTVVSRSSMQADALSTALFVLGRERGEAFLQRQPKTAAVFVDEDGGIFRYRI